MYKLSFPSKFFVFPGIATITVLGDQGASGIVGVASSSTHILIGEPIGRYNGTAFIG